MHHHALAMISTAMIRIRGARTLLTFLIPFARAGILLSRSLFILSSFLFLVFLLECSFLFLRIELFPFLDGFSLFSFLSPLFLGLHALSTFLEGAKRFLLLVVSFLLLDSFVGETGSFFLLLLCLFPFFIAFFFLGCGFLGRYGCLLFRSFCSFLGLVVVLSSSLIRLLLGKSLGLLCLVFGCFLEVIRLFLGHCGFLFHRDGFLCGQVPVASVHGHDFLALALFIHASAMFSMTPSVLLTFQGLLAHHETLASGLLLTSEVVANTSSCTL